MRRQAPSHSWARRARGALPMLLGVVTVLGVLGFAAWFLRARAATVQPLVGIVASSTLPALSASHALPATLIEGDDLLIAWTAQAQAGLEPCGCVAGMHGGLARRARLLARVSGDRVLALDGGGWLLGAADYQILKAQVYAQASRASGIAALGVGAADVRLGAKVLRSVLSVSGRAEVVCANVVVGDGATLAIRSALRIDNPRGALWVTSLLPGGITGDGVSSSDPTAGLIRVLDQAKGETVIVLLDDTVAAAAALAAAVPGAAVIIAGAERDPLPVPRAVGSTRIVGAGNHGKVLGWFAPGRGGRLHHELITDQIPDLPVVREHIQNYQERLGMMNLALDERIGGLTVLGSGHAAKTWAGTPSCSECHADAHQKYSVSRHAFALKALEKKGYARDPECLKCHVTGLSQPGGWSRRDGGQPWAGAVSCESCHGRASAHVAVYTALKAKTPAPAGADPHLDPVTPATCITCHDGDNSPHFRYDTYWPRIAH